MWRVFSFFLCFFIFGIGYFWRCNFFFLLFFFLFETSYLVDEDDEDVESLVWFSFFLNWRRRMFLEIRLIGNRDVKFGFNWRRIFLCDY